MSSYALNNVTAPDAYAATGSGGAILEIVEFAEHVNIDVTNQAIFWQVKQAAGQNDTVNLSTWQQEVFMIPGSRSLYRKRVNGIRFRAATPAAQLPAGSSQAQVTAEIVT